MSTMVQEELVRRWAALTPRRRERVYEEIDETMALYQRTLPGMREALALFLPDQRAQRLQWLKLVRDQDRAVNTGRRICRWLRRLAAGERPGPHGQRVGELVHYLRTLADAAKDERGKNSGPTQARALLLAANLIEAGASAVG